MMQDYKVEDVRASAVLTGSYVAGTVLNYTNVNPALHNQLNLLVSFTIGSLTTCEIKIEYSHDGSNYYQETFEAISGGTSSMSLGAYQLSATGNYVISVPIKSSYIKVSAKGTGTVTNSLLAIQAVVGTV